MKNQIYDDIKTHLSHSSTNLINKYYLHIKLKTSDNNKEIIKINIHHDGCSFVRQLPSFNNISKMDTNHRFWIGPFFGMFNAIEACLYLKNIFNSNTIKVKIQRKCKKGNDCIDEANNVIFKAFGFDTNN